MTACDSKSVAPTAVAKLAAAVMSCAVGLYAATASQATERSDQLQTWTSANGQYSIEATLVDRQYDRHERTTLVTLRTAEGQEIRVPQAELSRESRDLARQLMLDRLRARRQQAREQQATATHQREAERLATARQLQSLALEVGQVVEKHTPHGTYLQYLPRHQVQGIVVVVHGTPGDNEPALDNAAKYIQRWLEPAEMHGMIVVAPAFDQQNFGGKEGPGGGYRGLFGRTIGADDFVNEIVDHYPFDQQAGPVRFLLYGHSAGGQFVSRYVVLHPERIAAAVISAAGGYAMPDPATPWPNGMSPLARTMQWPGATEVQQLRIEPDPAGWLAAAQLPITVVIGDRDNGNDPPRGGHPSNNRLDRARDWVVAMNQLAEQHGKPGGVRLVVVPGGEHSSHQLTPTCLQALWPD